MKKVLVGILSVLFIVNVEAATSIRTYNESINASKTYINSYKDVDKYISMSNNKFIYKNGKVNSSSNFTGSGGVLNEDEFKIGKEYLYNGLNFWIISNIDGKYSIVDPEYKNNDYINDTMSQSDKSGIRVTAFAKSSAGVTGLGTRLNPWEFAKRQFEVKIIVENGSVATTPIYITEDMDGSVSVVGNNGYAFDSVSCTNSQNAVYENGKINIKSIFANTQCTVKFVNPGKTISYKEEEQTYDVKYSGYYELDAYGAQGNGSGGKGGHTYGKVYLEKDTKLVINTGGQNGYNGGGSGYYNGGGATTVNASGEDLMIAAGGGGGKDANAGGNGDSKGGASVGAEAGSDGTNHGGGGSSYNYTYKYNCNDCYTGENTCVGGTISYNCSSCHTGHNTCVSGKEEYNCNDCASTKKVCKEGYDRKCKTCTYKGTTCSYNMVYNASEQKCRAKPDFKVTGSCKCTNGKYNGLSSCTNQGCLGESNFYRYSTTIDKYGTVEAACSAIKNGSFSVTGVCRHEAYGDAIDPDSVTNANCDKCGYDEIINECKTQEEQCVRKCDERENPCLTGENTCASGCDNYYNPCKTGHNTCEYGCDTSTKEYKSGYGGSNVLSSNLKDSKSESGTNTGNGYVKINFYKER